MWIAPNAIQGCNGQHRREPCRGSIIKSLSFKIFCYIQHWINGWIINNSRWTHSGFSHGSTLLNPLIKKDVISTPIRPAQGRLREESLNNTAVFSEKRNVLLYSILKKMSSVVFSPPQETRGWPQCGDHMRVIGLHNQSWCAGKPRSGLMWIAPHVRGCNGLHHREPCRVQ